MSLKIGLQLYSVRNAMAEDPIRTIRQVGEIGYRYLELANLSASVDFGCGFGVSARELMLAAQDSGCSIVSAHIDPFDLKNADRVLEYHCELGTKFLISKPMSFKRDEVMRSCETYNILGEKCRALGIQHALHTSLAPYLDDGSWILDVIFGNTDPENLKFEVDTYWMMRSGYDPIEVVKRFADRVVAVHQKDLPKDFSGELNINKLFGKSVCRDRNTMGRPFHEEDFCEIGTGQMDIQTIIQVVNSTTKAEYIILEQDFTKHTEMESISISLKNLKKYSGVSEL